MTNNESEVLTSTSVVKDSIHGSFDSPDGPSNDKENSTCHQQEEDADEAESMSTPPQDFCCPITQDLFRHPVQDFFGHTYERSAILAWLSANGTCPMTRKAMRASDLIPNALMKTRVRLWRRQHCQSPTQQSDNSAIYVSGDDYDDDDDDSFTDNVLIGYLSMPFSTAESDDTDSRQRTTRQQQQGYGSGWSTPSSNGATEEFPLDRLLAEYDRIMEEDENRSQMERERRNQRHGNHSNHQQVVVQEEDSSIHNNAIRLARSRADNFLGNDIHVVQSMRNNSAASLAAKRRARDALSLRGLLFPRRTKNLGMTATAC